MKFSKTFLAFAIFLLIISQAGAATIVGNLMDIYGAGIDRTIKISPKSTPQAVIYNGTNYTVMDLAKTVSSTNSVFAVNLIGGFYNVDFGTVNGIATPVVKILVPPYDTNTYAFNYVANLATNLGTFVWTNSYGISAGTNIIITTNGALLTINSSAVGLTPGQIATLASAVTNGEYSGNAAIFTRNNGRQMTISPRDILLTITSYPSAHAYFQLDSGNPGAGQLDLASSSGSVYLNSRYGSGDFSGSINASNFTASDNVYVTNKITIDSTGSGDGFFMGTNQMISGSKFYYYGNGNRFASSAGSLYWGGIASAIFAGSGGGLFSTNGTQIFDSSTTNFYGSSFFASGNIYVTNHAYDASGSLLDPEGNEYVTATFVRSVLNNGAFLYGTTNTTGVGFSNIVNGATNSVSLQFGPNAPAAYIKGFTNFVTGTYTNGPYFASIISTNTYQAINGPFVNDFYIAAGGASPEISITPDIFVTYNKTNLIPICEGSGQALITDGTTNLYTWIQSAAQYNSTNSAGFYVVRRVRVVSQSGNNLYINVFGGNGYATSMSFNTPVTVNANYSGTFTGNGSGLTNIYATNLVGLGTAAYSNATAFAASTVTNLTAGQIATIAAAVTNNANPTLTGLSVGAQTAIDSNGNGKFGGAALTNGVLTGNGSGLTNVSASLPSGVTSLAIGSLTLTNAVTIKTNSTIPTLVQNVNTTCIPSSSIDPTSNDGLIILSYLAAAGTTMPANSNYFTITLSQPAISTNSLVVIATANVTQPAAGATIAANSSLNRFNIYASSNSFILASGTSVPPTGFTNQLIYLQVYRR